MTDRQLRLFLSVAELGSFSRAEEREYISKQAILRQINALEAEVGVPLLRRTPGGVTLTEPGQVFRRGAEKLLLAQRKLLAECRERADGGECLRIGQVEHQALLHEVTDAFALRYPDIRIQKVIHPNHSREYRVEHGIVDVGETFYTSITAKMSAAYTRLADLPFVAAMGTRHPLADRTAVGLSDLADYTVVLFRQMTPSHCLTALQAAFAGRLGRLVIRSDVDNQVAAAFACAGGRDIFLTANYFVRSVPTLRLVPLDTGWRQEYGIIYRTPLTPAVRKYVDLAVSIFSGRAF